MQLLLSETSLFASLVPVQICSAQMPIPQNLVVYEEYSKSRLKQRSIQFKNHELCEAKQRTLIKSPRAPDVSIPT